MKFLKKLKRLLKGKRRQVEAGLDKAADFADKKTGGKYSEKIDDAVDKAKDVVEKLDDK